MALLNIISALQAYGDSVQTSQPLQKFFDWTKKLSNIQVTRPSSRQYYVDPGATLTVFNGQRSTNIDGTTVFSVTLSPIQSSRYRITNVFGTSPALRTARTLQMNGVAITITTIANGTIQLNIGSGVVGGDFSGVQAGDQVWIPGVTTGDSAGPFNNGNEGLWSVVSVGPVSATANRLLTLKRLSSSDPAGAAEVVTPSTNTQIVAFSAAGVQVGDNVEFASSSWTAGIRNTYAIDKVTPGWFEILSTQPLPLDTSVTPTATGLVFYADVRRYVRLEVDQEAAIQLNGDTGQLVRVSPLSAADPNATGWFEKWGPTWSLAVVNRSSVQLTLTVIAAD